MKRIGVRPVAICAGVLLGAALVAVPAMRSAASSEADQLKDTLTPFGAIRAASSDGSIPAWTGTAPTGGFRDDPFGKEAPLFTITSKNVQQYAPKLTEGQRALFAKYPDYRIVVYPTHRTAAAPQWVYDATYENAVHGKMSGFVPTGVFGGIPFPIPKNGSEVMWNHLLRWRQPSWQFRIQGVETGSDGRHVETVDGAADLQMPYYFKGEQSRWNGDYYLIRLLDLGPPIRTGESVVGRQNVNDSHTRSWVYLTGQRRTRELPNPCCDTPSPESAGVMSFDEIEGWTGRIDRFDWKLLGRKEIYVPYNDNGANAVSNDLLLPHFLNPDRVRYELHRVWAVEATLRAGQRHESPHGMFYLDEDSWAVILADRWDAHNQLWKTTFDLTFPVGDPPAIVLQTFGQYDLQSGAYFVNGLLNRAGDYYRATARFPDDDFTAQAMLRGAR